MPMLTPIRLLAAASCTTSQDDDKSGLKFIHRCGVGSHIDFGSARTNWPLPLLRTCNALAVYADARGILMEDPAEGDVFLKYSGFHHRYVRAGIVATVDFEYTWDGRSVYLCTVIESGITHGSALTPLTGDRFVRWSDLEGKRHAA